MKPYADKGSMPCLYYFKQYIDFKAHPMITQWYDLILYVDHSSMRRLHHRVRLNSSRKH